jgi:SP family sugar:H+ symporter-like MFS transporter
MDRAINGILAMRQFKDQFSTGHTINGLPDLTNKQASIVVAILSIGTVVGSILSAPIADSFLGRRFSMLLSCAVFCLGGILQTVAQALPMLLAGRYACILCAVSPCDPHPLAQVWRAD